MISLVFLKMANARNQKEKGECMTFSKEVEKWSLQEITVSGHSTGNPFKDNYIECFFKGKYEEKLVNGFYDGEGTY